MNKRKLYNLLISLLMVFNVFVTPLRAIAQEAAPSAPTAQSLPAEDTENTETQPAAPAATQNEEAPVEESSSTASQEAGQTGFRAANAALQAGEISLSEVGAYEMSTNFTINTNPVKNNGKYGEGKFYISPTYTFNDSTVIKAGDTLVYQMPNALRLERVDNLTILDQGVPVGTLSIDPTTNKATITFNQSGEEHYKTLSEDKNLTVSFTAVWDDSVKKNEPVTFTIPGDKEYTLTRIVVDDDLYGYTKWGVQNKQDPTLVDWRIRINRYAQNDVTNVVLKDAIPDNQELVPGITGYYFTRWENEEVDRAGSFNPADVIQQDDNSFTIQPNGGNLSGKGLFLIYQTRIVGDVDEVNKRVYNNVHMEGTNIPSEVVDFDGFAPITDTSGAASGAKHAAPVLSVTKTLNGRTLNAGEFSFELVDNNGAVVQTVTNDANGNVTFKALKFKEVGTFEYTIREKASGVAGVEDDTNKEIKATIVVSDNLGKKEAEVTYSRPGFVNNYYAKSVNGSITFTKNLVGRTQKAGEFEFVLKDDQGVDVATATNDANGNVQFDNINFTTAGTFNYTVEEKQGSAKGVRYDTTKLPLQAVVTDDGQGQLSVVFTQPNGSTFTNTYQAEATRADITVSKALTGRAQNAGEFNFVLKDGSGAQVATATNTANGTVTFAGVVFTATGTYNYTVEEVPGNVPGVTYTTNVVNVTIEVTDDGNGQLSASVSYPNGSTFTNTYKAAAAQANVGVVKTLTGRTLAANEFSFDLKNPQGTVVATATNDENGNVIFARPLSFDAAGEYNYTVEEKPGNVTGVTYDTKVVTAKVTVTDDGSGQLKAVVTYPNGNTFANSYKPLDNNLVLSVAKRLTGRALVENEFGFEVKDASGNVVATAKNTADGKVEFTPITFTQTGTFKYTINEVKGDNNTITYDAKVINVTVEVVDNNGQLVATPTYDGDRTLTNTYTPTATKAEIKVQKTLQGRTLADGEFNFTLKGDNVEKTAANKADGSVSFGEFDYATAGTYTYTVTEDKGSMQGITYDVNPVVVTVKVVDNNGQLEATVETSRAFVNTYQASPGAYTITTLKELLDADGNKVALTDGQFEFSLKGEGQEVTAKNDAQGNVVFNVNLTKAGENQFVITENAEETDTMAVDTHKLTVKVQAVDNGKGEFVMQSYSFEGETKFVNRLKKVAGDPRFTVVAKKELQGREQKAGEFSFELVEGDRVVATATNAANGEIVFEGKLTGEGDHKLVAREVKGTDATITYDTRSFDVTVNVAKNAAGTLETKVSHADIHFVNKYMAKALPNTGETNIFGFVAVIALMLVAVAGYLVFRFNKKI